MSNVESILNRWITALRQKASEYEHPASLSGEPVVYPSLDDICNEMEAYKAGVKP